jgi:hypothetical protein
MSASALTLLVIAISRTAPSIAEPYSRTIRFGKRASTPERPVYRSIAELPGVPDAAFIAVPNHEAPVLDRPAQRYERFNSAARLERGRGLD